MRGLTTDRLRDRRRQRRARRSARGTGIHRPVMNIVPRNVVVQQILPGLGLLGFGEVAERRRFVLTVPEQVRTPVAVAVLDLSSLRSRLVDSAKSAWWDRPPLYNPWELNMPMDDILSSLPPRWPVDTPQMRRRVMAFCSSQAASVAFFKYVLEVQGTLGYIIDILEEVPDLSIECALACCDRGLLERVRDYLLRNSLEHEPEFHWPFEGI